MRIDRHLELHLGTIVRGWGSSPASPRVQVVQFDNQPRPGVATYATLGLSNHVLGMPEERSVRQELVFSAYPASSAENLAALLFHVAASIEQAHVALLRGGVIPLGYPLEPHATCSHLYACVPVVFPAGLAVCEDTDPPTAFAWLFGITDAEMGYIHKNGWSAFEDILERADPDLFALDRGSVV